LSRWQKARSERIEYIAINTVAFNNVSGGTLRRPPLAYIASNVSSRSTSHGVDHGADLADRMIRRDQLLRAQRRQHRQLLIRAATHTHSLFDPRPDREHPQPSFSTLLVLPRINYNIVI
jgi:hypothetical protein